MLRSTESLSEDARGYGGRPSASIVTQSATTRRPSTVSTLSNENTYSDVDRHWSVLDARVCLPAILNDPRHPNRSKPNEPAPIIPPSRIPEANHTVFNAYLKKLKNRSQKNKSGGGVEEQNPFRIEHQSDIKSVPNRFYEINFEIENELKTGLTGNWQSSLDNVVNYDVKLKGWLDQTEVELGRRLSNRAASFLAAVSAQDQLKNIIVNSLKKSASLRQNVNGIGAKVTHGPLEVMRHRIKSKRLQETVNLLTKIETVKSSPDTIHLLLETGDFVSANNWIKTVRSALNNELKGISCLRNLSQKMDELEKQLNEMLVDEARNIFEMLIRNGDKDEERFTSIQLSIVHANRTADTIQSIHDVIEREANLLLALTNEKDDLELKIKTDTEALKGLLASVCMGVMIPEFDILKKSSIEVIQHRLLRNLQEIDFSGRKEFPSYLPILVDFSSHCHQLTGVNGPIVQHMKSETQKYLNRFHEERRQRLTLLLDNEEWRAAEVPKELQEAVDHVLLQGHGCQTEKETKLRPRRNDLILNYVDVSGEKFSVIGASLLLIRMIQDYLNCLVKLPETSLLHKLADILSLFNSRCCQLVLGGGATTTIGMKSITIKHLALTARSLQLVLRVLPSVRGAATSVLSSNSSASVSIRQLNKVEQDVQTHIQEVWGKICSIMQGFFDKHISNYELKAPIPSPTMKTIVKQIKKLSDSLNEVLPPAELVALISRVHSLFTKTMDSRLEQKTISQNDGLLLSEVSFYMSNIRKLPGMAGIEWN